MILSGYQFPHFNFKQFALLFRKSIMPKNSNRAQELLDQTNEALARKFGNSVETEIEDGHSHTISGDTDITNYIDGHHHNKGKNGVTGPAIYLDGTVKDTHTHKYDEPIKTDREMPKLPSSV